MSEITPRQGQILAAIVKEYSQTGRPVGSEELAEKYRLAFSSATIRNEMKLLEQAGLITQPHTSAGRVPSDRGHRYFVSRLMHHLELTAGEQQRLRQELLKLKRQYLELGRGLSRLLAERAEGAAFALLPEGVTASGFSKIVEQDVDRQELREMAKFLDELEQHGKTLIKRDMRAVETYIGRDAPMPLTSDFSLVVTKVELPDGQKGIIGIIGPKRMKYARNISLLEYVSKLLASGLGAYVIFYV